MGMGFEVGRSLEGMESLLQNIHYWKVIKQSRTQPPMAEKMRLFRGDQWGRTERVCIGLGCHSQQWCCWISVNPARGNSKRTTWDRKSYFFGQTGWIALILCKGQWLILTGIYTYARYVLGFSPSRASASVTIQSLQMVLLTSEKQFSIGFSHFYKSYENSTDILCPSLPMIFVKWMDLSDRYCISLWSNGELCLLLILMICVL